MFTHLCCTLPQFNHLKQAHDFHPILLMVAIYPAMTRDSARSPTFGPVCMSFSASPACLLETKTVSKWTKHEHKVIFRVLTWVIFKSISFVIMEQFNSVNSVMNSENAGKFKMHSEPNEPSIHLLPRFPLTASGPNEPKQDICR